MIKQFKSIAAIAALAVVAVSGARAQPSGFINAGVVNGWQTYISTGKNANRVGSGVLTYVHQVKDGFSSSQQVLAACDGSWLTDSVRYYYDTIEDPIEMEKAARENAPEHPVLQVVLAPWQESSHEFAQALKLYVKTLGRDASPEPRNVSIPLASFGGTITNSSSANSSGTTAVLSGTVVRKGAVIEAWMRTTFSKLEPFRVKGKPLVVDGETKMQRVASGPYEIRRTAFNCAERTFFVNKFIAYNQDGTVSSDVSAPAVRPVFDAVIPNSIAEGQLEAVCKIYGDK